jgi:hypothetical protein
MITDIREAVAAPERVRDLLSYWRSLFPECESAAEFESKVREWMTAHPIARVYPTLNDCMISYEENGEILKLQPQSIAWQPTPRPSIQI